MAEDIPASTAEPTSRPIPDSPKEARRRAWFKKDSNQKTNFFARWFFGLLKEFRRIQWMKGSDIIENIFVVLITILILIGLFAAVDAVFLGGRILGG